MARAARHILSKDGADHGGVTSHLPDGETALASAPTLDRSTVGAALASSVSAAVPTLVTEPEAS